MTTSEVAFRPAQASIASIGTNFASEAVALAAVLPAEVVAI